MKILITGHTGFIGGYLATKLLQNNHSLFGVSKSKPQEIEFVNQQNVVCSNQNETLTDAELTNAFYQKTQIGKNFTKEFFVDLANFEEVFKIVDSVKPDVIYHLAAQRLVNVGYDLPLETYQANVISTQNIFEAVQKVNDSFSNNPPIRAIVQATTDKVYSNTGEIRRDFIESDPLGAADPMSTSKVCSDLIAQSYAYNPKFTAAVGIARIGNAVGSLDSGKGLLLVDILNAFKSGSNPKLRSPNATRPWTSVIDLANGLFLLSERLLDNSIKTGEAFNFGPKPNNIIEVQEMTKLLAKEWENEFGSKFGFDDESGGISIKEAQNLGLNSSKAKELLNWEAELSTSQIAKKLVEFEKRASLDENIFEIINSQMNI